MITYEPVDSKKVMEVVANVHELLNRFSTQEVYTGLIVSSIITQKPDITTEQLQSSVKNITEFIAMQIGTVGETIN